MPTVLVRESLGGGRAKDLQDMDFDEVPRQGDLLKISIGSVAAKFVVKAIMHDIALGRKNKIVVIVQSLGGGGAGAAPGAVPQHAQLEGAAQTVPALPPASEPVKKEDSLYYV
jgi:hypothetical protein